jgi:3'-phosphoadenosine 5'-phosphosulfate sulfotransferase (PAPS reductase)/FAD synthetase
MKFIVTCSGGNDSIALIQFMQDAHEGDFSVLYNNTGWARQDWPKRIQKVKEKCSSLGINFFETKSEGMVSLVKRKKGWPMPASKMQFCTSELKEKPSTEFYKLHDPNCQSVIVTGRRREESSNRANLGLWNYESEKHGGRDVYNPLINHTAQMRDDLIYKFGFEPLNHSSMECYPCVCANKQDLAAMSKDDPRIDLIETVEIEMGHTRNKKPRTMFRPYRVGGGVGIRQAIDWGHGERGYKSSHIPAAYIYTDGAIDDGANDVAYSDNLVERRQCDGGFCSN